MIHVLFVAAANANPMVKTIEDVKLKLGADVGVAVYDISSDDLWSYNGDTRFPLMSTFKTLACAKLLVDIDNGEQSFDTSVVIKKASLVTWSPVTEKHVGEKFSLRQACSATMIMSDNTAANIVLNGINGPTALTQFMRSIGDPITRLDRVEPYLGEALAGDVRDTTTPNAMVKSLHKLLFGNALSAANKTQLKQWMTDNKVSDSLLRSVLPVGWTIADRSGAGGYGSRGITAVVWSEQHSPLIVAIYLTQTEASFAQRNKAIAQIGKEIFSYYR
ncbi:class A beta-lactamase [Thalassotalea sp. ND16A]|uniref:class A beta-lactamase n=1 Tax=Thalassotalea sp. ND16A TaxID=1535422 RepID=UPI00051A8B7D|nr:class A beta-lactamase [Thalassotalea sp. ND16A]